MLMLQHVFICMCAVFSVDNDVEPFLTKHQELAAYESSLLKASLATIDTVDDTTAIALEYLRMRETIFRDRIGSRSDRFIGYLTGRLRVDPPEWWLDELRDGVVNPQRIVRFDSRHPEGSWTKDEHGVRFSGVHAVTIDASKLKLEEAGQVTTVLHRKDFREGLRNKGEDSWNGESDGAFAATIRNREFAVAFQCPATDAGGPEWVFYGDAITGKPKWRAQLSD